MVFVKGQPSSNMKGRPIASFSLVQMLKDKLQSVPEGDKESVASKAIDAYLLHLAEGKVEILKDAFDRIDGKPKQDVGLSGQGEDGALEIRIKMV